MILQTNLRHITSESDFRQVLLDNENVMICCGRMGPMCVPVYSIMLEISSKYPHVAFYDMAFDAPFAHVIRNAPEAQGFMGLPFTFYYKKGKAVAATSSIQSKDQVEEILRKSF